MVLNILIQHTEYFLGHNIKLFTSDDMERYKVAQYDEDDWDVQADLPLDDFLDELYDAIMCKGDNK